MAILLKLFPSFVMSGASCRYVSIYLLIHPNSLIPPSTPCEVSSIILPFVDFCTSSHRWHHVTLFIDLQYQEQLIDGGRFTPFNHFTQNPTWYQAVRITEVCRDVLAVIDHIMIMRIVKLSTGDGKIMETLDNIGIKLLCCIVPVSMHSRLCSVTVCITVMQNVRLIGYSKRTDCWCTFSWSICNQNCHFIMYIQCSSFQGYDDIHKSWEDIIC